MINYSTHVFHTFKSKESIDITDNRHIDFYKEGGIHSLDFGNCIDGC